MFLLLSTYIPRSLEISSGSNMKAEKLQMCRICLMEDIHMYMVTNVELQKVFEKLTDNPFLTEDRRPMLACVVCYTRLKQCCQLQRKCLEAEKLFTQMLNGDDETKPLIQQGLVEFVISPTEIISIIDESQLESVVIKEELPDDCEGHNDINEIMEEHLTEFEYPDSFPVPNWCESDSEDNTPFTGFKTEVKIDPAEFMKVQVDRETAKAPDVKKLEPYVRLTRLEDTMRFQQMKTEQPDSIIWNTQKPSSKARSKRVTNSKKASNSVNNTSKSMNDRKYKFKCDVCQRSFTHLSFLQMHDRIHTGEKPYKCEVCQQRFNQRSNLTSHMHRHTDEKLYKCLRTQCTYTYL